VQLTLRVDLSDLEEAKADEEAANDGWNDEHDTLQHDQNHHVDLAEAHHAHNTQVETLRLHREHKQRVNKKDADQEEQQHDQVEDQLEESD